MQKVRIQPKTSQSSRSPARSEHCLKFRKQKLLNKRYLNLLAKVFHMIQALLEDWDKGGMWGVCSLDKGPMGITGEGRNQTCWLITAGQSSLENRKGSL